MRKALIAIAIAIVALVVGLAAGYRSSRPDEPTRKMEPAAAGSESNTDAPPVPRETQAPQPSTQGAPESHRSGDVEPIKVEHDRGLSSRPSGFEKPRSLPVPEPSSENQPAPGIDANGSPVPLTPPKGGTAPPEASPPQPPPPPTTATSTSTANESAAKPAGKESAEAGEADDPESDRQPPTLQFLRFDPAETKGGGAAILTVSSTDDLSGVKLIYGSVRSPGGSASVPFSARDANGSGEFVATIAVPAQAETGDWYVANLQIVDKADNALALAFARTTVPVGGTLRVVSEDSDATAPTVRRVSVARGVVDAGERNQIVVDVDDDRSGVALVTGAFQSPSKAAFIPFTCTPNGGSIWEGDILVPSNADCGEWTLRQLRVVDKANNSAFLAMDAPQIGHVGFVVSGGGQCDSEPPVLDRVTFAPAVVSNAEAATVVVTVTAHDDASGVASVSGWIEGPVATNGQPPRIYFSCTPDPREPDAPMIARIAVAQYAANGIWRLSVAQVADKARNTRSYNVNDPILRDAIFVVE